MREGRFRMIDLCMEEKTQIRTEVPESPIGYYLLDLEDNINYPLKDGWHFDISKDGDIFTYFTIRYIDDRITIHSELEGLFINYVMASDFVDDIGDDALIEYKDGKNKDQFILSTNRNLTLAEAKKIIGRCLVMNSDKARQGRQAKLEDDLVGLNNKLEEVEKFFSTKEELESLIENSSDLIAQKKAELAELEEQAIECQVRLKAKFSKKEVTAQAELKKDLESQIKNVNSELAKIKK